MAHDDRRRIDEVLAPGFLDDLRDLPVSGLRSKRATCQSVEEVVSYRRRVLQGRIDVARAERARRAGETEGGLIEALPGILADRVSHRREQTQARPSPVYVPDPGHTRRAEDADEAVLSRLPDLDDGELEALIERLSREEEALSARRRQVLERLDAVKDQLVARLRDNPGEIAGILTDPAGGSPPEPPEPAESS